MPLPKEWTLDELKRAMSSFGDAYQGASEGITSVATGLGASIPAGWQALTAAMGGASPEEATRRFEETQRGLTYEPRTPEGQGFVQSVASRFEPLNAIAQWSGGKAADLAQKVPVVGPHLAPAAGAAVDTAIQFAPVEMAMGGASALRGGARAAATHPAVQSFLSRALAEPQHGVAAPPFEWWKQAQVAQEPHPVKPPRPVGPTPELETRPAAGGAPPPPPAAPGLPELKLPPELAEEPVVVGPPRPEATGAQPAAPAGIQQAAPARSRGDWLGKRMEEMKAGEQFGSATNVLPAWQKAALGEAAAKAEQGGFTMRMVGEDPRLFGSGPFPDKGFAFVPEQGHEQILSHAPRPREIEQFIEAHKGTLKRDWEDPVRGEAVPVVGDWRSEGGRHHMEVGRVAPHEPGRTDDMLRLAGKADQRAVYDLGAGKEIPVPDKYRPVPYEEPAPAPAPDDLASGPARPPAGEHVYRHQILPGEGLERGSPVNRYRRTEGGEHWKAEKIGRPGGALKHRDPDASNFGERMNEGSLTRYDRTVGLKSGEFVPAEPGGAPAAPVDPKSLAKEVAQEIAGGPDRFSAGHGVRINDLEPGEFARHDARGAVMMKLQGPDKVQIVENPPHGWAHFGAEQGKTGRINTGSWTNYTGNNQIDLQYVPKEEGQQIRQRAGLGEPPKSPEPGEFKAYANLEPVEVQQGARKGAAVSARNLKPGQKMLTPAGNIYRMGDDGMLYLEKQGAGTSGMVRGAVMGPKGGHLQVGEGIPMKRHPDMMGHLVEDDAQMAWGGPAFGNKAIPEANVRDLLAGEAKKAIRKQGGDPRGEAARDVNEALGRRDAFEAAVEARVRAAEQGNGNPGAAKVESIEGQPDFFKRPEWAIGDEEGAQGSFRAPLDIAREKGKAGIVPSEQRGAFQAGSGPGRYKAEREAQKAVRAQGGEWDPYAAHQVQNALERRDAALEGPPSYDPKQRDFFKHPEWVPGMEGASGSDAQGYFRAREEGWQGVDRKDRGTFNVHAREPNRPGPMELKEIIRNQGGRVRQEHAKAVNDALDRRDAAANATGLRETAEGQERLPWGVEMKREAVREMLERQRDNPAERWDRADQSQALGRGGEGSEKENIAAHRANRGAEPKTPEREPTDSAQRWLDQNLKDQGEPGWDLQNKSAIPGEGIPQTLQKRELARPEEERARLYRMLKSGSDAEWEDLARNEGGPSAHFYAGKGHAKNSLGQPVGSTLEGPVAQDASRAKRRFENRFNQPASGVTKVDETFQPSKDSSDVRKMLARERRVRHPPGAGEAYIEATHPDMWEGDWDFDSEVAQHHKKMIEKFPDVTGGNVPGHGKDAFNPKDIPPEVWTALDDGMKEMITKSNIAGSGMINRSDPRFPIGQVRLFGKRQHESFPLTKKDIGNPWGNRFNATYTDPAGEEMSYRAGPPGWQDGFVDKAGGFMSRLDMELLVGDAKSEVALGHVGRSNTKARKAMEKANRAAEVKRQADAAAAKAAEEERLLREREKSAAAKFDKENEAKLAEEARLAARRKELFKEKAEREKAAREEKEMGERAAKAYQERYGWAGGRAAAERDTARWDFRKLLAEGKDWLELPEGIPDPSAERAAAGEEAAMEYAARKRLEAMKLADELKGWKPQEEPTLGSRLLEKRGIPAYDVPGEGSAGGEVSPSQLKALEKFMEDQKKKKDWDRAKAEKRAKKAARKK